MNMIIKIKKKYFIIMFNLCEEAPADMDVIVNFNVVLDEELGYYEIRDMSIRYEK